ncbi:MAG TPA: ABC transporter ATP-binding protein [Jiangellales bacterium]|nr:ABC transporter ATP-binding protein [Jiangellales bacterium]
MTTPTLTAPGGPSTGAAPAASARDVTKVYGRGDAVVRALDGVTVDVAAGSFTAVMGPSGSGKSTLMHALAGLDTVDAGEIRLAGHDVTAMSERQRTRLRRDRVGFVFQAFNLVPALTAAENIALPVHLAGGKVDEEWFGELVATLGLRERLAHTPAQLSGGQQQRVAVARALVTRPDVVFADEPTGNLDSRAGAQLLGFLREAVRAMGQTVVMVTHDPVAASYADRVVFLADGRVVDELAVPDVDAVLDRMRHLDGSTEGR